MLWFLWWSLLVEAVGLTRCAWNRNAQLGLKDCQKVHVKMSYKDSNREANKQAVQTYPFSVSEDLKSSKGGGVWRQKVSYSGVFNAILIPCFTLQQNLVLVCVFACVSKCVRTCPFGIPSSLICFYLILKPSGVAKDLPGTNWNSWIGWHEAEM